MSIYADHCRDDYYREFAFKTVEGIDKPGTKGFLPGLRRLRTTPITNSKWLSYFINEYRNRPGEYVTVYSYSSLIKAGDKNSSGEPYKEYLINKAINYDSAKISRIYFDFDSEDNPQNALSEAILVMRELAGYLTACTKAVFIVFR